MFERYSMGNDLGDPVLRGFYKKDMIVATIDAIDLQEMQCEASLKAPNQFDFVGENHRVFLSLMWDKYARGEYRDRQRAGSVFKRVEISLSDMMSVRDQFAVC